MYPHIRSVSGFTLVELAIVLVIIGLLAGGILTGRDLIDAAQQRALAKQIEELSLGVNAFKLKYNCLPGDCARATDFGLGTVGGPGDNGDGDGVIEQSIALSYNGPERSNFWYHLGGAHLITGEYPVGTVPGVNSPLAKLQGSKVASSGSNGGFWVINGSVGDPFLGPSQHAWTIISATTDGSHSGIFLPRISAMIDRKIDDGYPLTGDMIVINSKAFTPMCGGVAPFCNNIYHLFTISCVIGSSQACPGLGWGAAVGVVDDRVTPPIYNLGATTPGMNSSSFPVIRSKYLVP